MFSTVVDVVLHGVGDGEIVVDDLVGDGVQDDGGPLGQLLGHRLQGLAERAERAVPAVPDGDHEVGAGEDHQLAGVHDVADGGELLVLDVAAGLEDGEQGARAGARRVVPLQLGPLMGLDGVLDGERMQPEELGESGELGLVRLVQPDPDETAALLAHLPERLLRRGLSGLAHTVLVDHAVDHGAAQR